MFSGRWRDLAQALGGLTVAWLVVVGALVSDRLQRADSEIKDRGSANEQSSVASQDAAAGSVETSNVSTTEPNPSRAQDEPEQYSREYVVFGDRPAQGWMAIASLVGVALSGLTIFLIWRTIELQRTATEHALSAAEAGWESAEGAKAAAAAYVHVVAVFVPGRRPTEDAANGLVNMMFNTRARLVVTLENIGQTVAKNVDLRVQLFSEPTRKEMLNFKPLTKPIAGKASNIAPTQRPDVDAIVDLAKAVRDSARAGEPPAPDTETGVDRTVRGEVFYDDIFDNTYRSAFVYQLLWDPNQTAPFDGPLNCWTIPGFAPAFELVKSAKQKKEERARRA